MIEPKITLKAARVNAELTLDDVAEIVGKSKQTIENWENGKTPIKYSDLIKLSELYEMPVKYLRIPDGDEWGAVSTDLVPGLKNSLTTRGRKI